MTPKELLLTIEVYALRVKKSPRTVCRDATGNFRLYDRLQRRVQQTNIDADRLARFMEANPPKDEKAAA